MTAIGAAATTGFRRWSSLSEFDLFRDPQCVIDFDTQISNCALKLAVAEQDLDSAQVARLLVDQGGLGSARRMGTVSACFKANAADPTLDDARVLPCGEMGRLTTFARE